jgi:hypothetical protein
MQNSSLSLTIAGGFYWCHRCQVNHVECSPCPNDPDYVPEDPTVQAERLKKAIELIKQNEETCRCMAVGRQFVQCRPCQRAEAKRDWPGMATSWYSNQCFGCKLRFSGPKNAVYCNVCRGTHEDHQ